MLVRPPTLAYTNGMRSFTSLSPRSLRVAGYSFALLSAAASLACGSGVQVEPVSVKAAPPGRVVALVSVSDRGSAAEDLSPDNFEVREGDVPLDPSQIGLRVQPFGQLAGHEAVVLV